MADYQDSAGFHKSLEYAEIEAAAEMDRLIPEHLSYAHELYNLLIRITVQFEERELTRPQDQGALLMIARLANDMRALSVLCRLGYADQACGLAATIFELSFTFAHIVRDGEAAADWLKHSDRRKSYLKVKEALRIFVESTPAIPTAQRVEVIDREYRVYAEMCIFKHGNPMSLGFVQSDYAHNYVETRIGPDFSEYGQKVACFAIENAGRLLELVVAVVLDACVPAENRYKIDHVAEQISEMGQRLAATSKAKWSGPAEEAGEPSEGA